MTKCHLSWDSYKKNICDGLSHFQQQDEFVDMTIAAEGHLVKVHRNLVALSSPYIREMLRSAPCQHPVVFLNNVSHETLGYILEFIYTGEVHVPINKMDSFLDAGKALHIKGLETAFFPLLQRSDVQQQKEDCSKSRETNPLAKPAILNPIIEGATEITLTKPKNIIYESLRGILDIETPLECPDNNDVEDQTDDDHDERFDDAGNDIEEHIDLHSTENLNKNDNDQRLIDDCTDIENQIALQSIKNQNKNDERLVDNHNTENLNDLHSIVNQNKNKNDESLELEDIENQIDLHSIVNLNKNTSNEILNADHNIGLSNGDQYQCDFRELMDIDTDKLIPKDVEVNETITPKVIELFPGENTVTEMDCSLGNENAQYSLDLKTQPVTILPLFGEETLSLNSEENMNLNVLLNEINTGTANIPNLETLTEGDVENVFSSSHVNQSNILINIPGVDSVDKHETTNDISGASPLYFLATAGSIQLALNRYMYYSHHSSVGGRKRRWRCIEYRKSYRCKAYIDTDADKITARKFMHEHPFHDNKIMQKGQNNLGVFTTLKELFEYKRKIDQETKTTNEKERAETRLKKSLPTYT